MIKSLLLLVTALILMFSHVAFACVDFNLSTDQKKDYIKNSAFTGVFKVIEVDEVAKYPEIQNELAGEYKNFLRPMGKYFFHVEPLNTYSGSITKDAIIFDSRSLDCSTLPLMEKGKIYRRVILKDKKYLYDSSHSKLNNQDWIDLAEKGKPLSAEKVGCDLNEIVTFKNDQAICVKK